MEFIKKDHPITTVYNVSVGETFEMEDAIYMKIDLAYIGSIPYNCVCLNTGKLIYFSDRCTVYKVNIENATIVYNY